MIIYTIIYIFSSIQPLVSSKPSNNFPITFQSSSWTQKTGDRADRADHPDRADHTPPCHLLPVYNKVRARPAFEKAHGNQAAPRFPVSPVSAVTPFLADFRAVRARHRLKYWYSDSKNKQNCWIGVIICALFRTFAPQF